MEGKFPTIPRVDLKIAPVKWKIECRNCSKEFKGHLYINSKFHHSLDKNYLSKHSIYCNDCAPEMWEHTHKLYNGKVIPNSHRANNLGDEIPDDEMLHICETCFLVSIGRDAIDENVYVKRDTKAGYQSECISCTRRKLDELK